MAKMGRPKSDAAKTKRLNLRLTESEFESIQYVANSLKLSISQAILVTMEERADEIFRIKNQRSGRENSEFFVDNN